MPEAERAEFLAKSPTGAICVVDEDGDLLALPARVVDVDTDGFTVDVDGADRDDTRRRGTTQACVVADTFSEYRAIRGIIAQGTVTWPPTSRDGVTMAVTRTVTFSFANA
jgi:predicted membrane-bound mannosyltransferase